MCKFCRFVYFLLLIFCSCSAFAQPAVTPANRQVQINSGVQILEDPHHSFTADSIFSSNKFTPYPDGILNLGITSSVYWLKIKLKNETESPRLMLKLSNPNLDSVGFFQVSDQKIVHEETGLSRPFLRRKYQSTDYLFVVDIPAHSEKYVYLRISSGGPLLAPLTAGSVMAIHDTDKYKDIFWGMYIGLMLAMLLYNCFVYLTTKDKSYLYYIADVLAVILAQMALSGYSFQLIWPNSTWLAQNAIFLTPPLAGLAGLEFMRHFLRTREYLPKADRWYVAFYLLYIAAVILCFAGKYNIGLNMVDMAAGTVSIYILVVAIIISNKGYRPAKFFLIAWIIFLAGVFVFVFKNFNILPYNNFTVYMMPIGSALEVLLLSFALADRINILKKEKEASQAEALKAVQENERIVREQNVILEKRVNERTFELKVSNDELNKAMVELKEAETQLVESEKMASLGQLTAGIAHEINNPINFVTSNVKPLNRDVYMLLDTVAEIERIMLEESPVAEKKKKIEEYKLEIDFDYLKEEIDQLLRGIGEGASRTAEIVKGLRIFSRLDEDDLKKADINEGLDSTLIITNNLLNNIIKIEKNYASLPLIECYPGKLNQVFLNIISNAIYAIKKKFGESEGGLLSISTSYDDHFLSIKLADNGTGMDDNTKKRLFEPFFTTKDVGEGTGLGMSIAYNTMNKHNGQVIVNSEIGVGTEFILKLPLIHK